jgi:DNA repair exonuclease SbcCD ATPase subunit
MDSALKKFIEKTGTVFKLQIALCNCEQKIARFEGKLPQVKKLLNKQSELAEQFRKWKHDVKKYYGNVESTQVCSHLYI